MNYGLPKTVTVGGEELAVRYDFRVILTILELLGDPELEDADKAEAIFELFYVNPEKIRNPREAVEACYQFIDMGEKSNKKSPRLMDWEQDFMYIIAPINRVLGREVRETPYDFDNNTGGLHWWTFMGAYMEIGSDCMFSQIVSIRDKRARGKKLEKHEREWMHRNLSLIEFKHKYTETENTLAAEWMRGKKNG